MPTITTSFNRTLKRIKMPPKDNIEDQYGELEDLDQPIIIQPLDGKTNNISVQQQDKHKVVIKDSSGKPKIVATFQCVVDMEQKIEQLRETVRGQRSAISELNNKLSQLSSKLAQLEKNAPKYEW